MAGFNRTTNRVADKTENAQCRLDKDIFDDVAARALEEGVSSAYYYRRWLLAGYKQDFTVKKKKK